MIQIQLFDLTAMGKKIQNYILQGIVGEGEFGKVYKALNEKTNQLVAIKIIKIQKFKMSPKLEEFTINEIQTLSKIQDTTHVVRFIQILKTANNYYFVYQFCNGGTLEQQIKSQGRFSESQAIKYFKDLLKAFQLLAKSNIMHRDIKPSNILLHNGVIKLADFGFCKPLKDSRDLSQTMLGSPIYMAPEILKGQIYTMKADIWSLGVVLYEMLFGFCPFEERTIARLISLIDQTSVVFPSNVTISPKTEELLRKMLVKDQFKRIGWQDLFAFNFQEQQNQEPKMYAGNPFSKKTTFTSIITQETKNRYLAPVDPHRLSSNTSNYQSHKKEPKYSVTAQEKTLIQNSLQARKEVVHGLSLLKQLLRDNSSKLTVSISSFLAKRVLTVLKGTEENLKKLTQDKENISKSKETKALAKVLLDEKVKIEEKLASLQSQGESTKEPLDILLLRFAEEEGLTQEREGLLLLVQLYDYLHQCKATDHSKQSKKELLDEYERRIIRKA